MNSQDTNLLDYVGKAKLRQVVIVQCDASGIEHDCQLDSKVLSRYGKEMNQRLLEFISPLMGWNLGDEVYVISAHGSVNYKTAIMVEEYFYKKLFVRLRTSDKLVQDKQSAYRKVVKLVKDYMPKTEILVLVADHGFWFEFLTQTSLVSFGPNDNITDGKATAVCLDIKVFDGKIVVDNSKVLKATIELTPPNPPITVR